MSANVIWLPLGARLDPSRRARGRPDGARSSRASSRSRPAPTRAWSPSACAPCCPPTSARRRPPDEPAGSRRRKKHEEHEEHENHERWLVTYADMLTLADGAVHRAVRDEPGRPEEVQRAQERSRRGLRRRRARSSRAPTRSSTARTPTAGPNLIVRAQVFENRRPRSRSSSRTRSTPRSSSGSARGRRRRRRRPTAQGDRGADREGRSARRAPATTSGPRSTSAASWSAWCHDTWSSSRTWRQLSPRGQAVVDTLTPVLRDLSERPAHRRPHQPGAGPPALLRDRLGPLGRPGGDRAAPAQRGRRHPGEPALRCPRSATRARSSTRAKPGSQRGEQAGRHRRPPGDRARSPSQLIERRAWTPERAPTRESTDERDSHEGATDGTAEDEAAEEKPKRSKKKMLIIAPRACCCVGGAGYWFFLKPTGGDAAPVPGEIVALDSIQINLAGRPLPRARPGPPAGRGRRPRSTAARRWTRRSTSSAAGPSTRWRMTKDRKQLKDELAGRARESATRERFMEVYFTDFVTQ